MAKVAATCVVCGGTFERERTKLHRTPPERRTCGVLCRQRLIARTRAPESYDAVRGERNPNWRGGTTKIQGYVCVRQPDHPRANHHGYVKRADLVLEEKLGRPLREGEIAHHKDENRENDDPSNVVLFKNQADHLRHHTEQRRTRGSYSGAQRDRERDERGRFK